MKIALEINRRLDLLVKDKDKPSHPAASKPAPASAPAPPVASADIDAKTNIDVALPPNTETATRTHVRANSAALLLPVAKGENPLESEDLIIQEVRPRDATLSRGVEVIESWGQQNTQKVLHLTSITENERIRSELMQ